MKGTTKVLLKLVNEDKNRVEWVHLCYVDAKLYNAYLEHFDITSSELNTVVARWIKEDFNLDVSMSRKGSLEILRGIVRDYYKRVYPDLFQENSIDRQGWVRVFIQKKMKEDLGPYYEGE